MIDERFHTRLNLRSVHITAILLFVAVFLWPFWILFDFIFAEELMFNFLPIRIFFCLFSLVGYFLLKSNRINELSAQLIFFIPPLATVAYMFNVVPESSLFIYFLGATMVLFVGFLALISPPIRSILYGSLAIGLIPIFHYFFDENSYAVLLANGGFVYLSLCLFGVGMAIVRYRTVSNAVRNELLLEDSKLELESSNKKLTKTIEERDVLLKEVHHRVKNNLQIISSLVKLQEDQIDKKSAKEMLQLSQDRIRSLAIIHECLYQTEDFNFLDFENYVETLTNYLKQTYNLDELNIEIRHTIEAKDLDMVQIVPCGLIINEAVTNSIKYAFDKAGGLIEIKSRIENGQFVLEIKDNGKGLGDILQINDSESLGIRLIKGLGQQLKGHSEFVQIERGTKILVTFNIENENGINS